MSNGNIVKSWFATQKTDKTIVIDTNTRMVTRLQEYEEQKRLEQKALMGKENEDDDGFVSGLFAEKIDTFTKDGEFVESIMNPDFYVDKSTEDKTKPAVEEAIPLQTGGMAAETMHLAWQELEKEKEYLEIAKTEYAKLEEELLKRKEEIELAEQALEERRQASEEEYQKRIELANEEAESLKKEAFDSGFQEGYEQGTQKALEELEIAKKELEDEKKQLEDDYEEKIQNLEPQFAETFSELYRYIFDVDFSKYKDIVPHLIISTFQKVDSGKNFIVHVSKADYLKVNEKKKAIQESVPNNANVDVVEDYTLKENECLIETDGGIFDCSLDTQLELLEKEIKILSYKRG